MKIHWKVEDIFRDFEEEEEWEIWKRKKRIERRREKRKLRILIEGRWLGLKYEW